VQSGRLTTVKVTLEGSPDTGFELTCDPPGQPIWLDGAPLRTVGGGKAVADILAMRIQPGHHVLEVRGGPFKDWRQDVEVEPGEIRKIHAILVPRRPGETAPSR